MKLKKIAALALAGVMAVSMLAGCANKPADSTPTEEPTTSSMATLVGEALTEKVNEADVKTLTVTYNKDLQAQLDKVADAYGVALSASNAKTAMMGLDANLKDATIPSATPGNATYATDSVKQSAFGTLYLTYNDIYTDAYTTEQIVNKILGVTVYSKGDAAANKLLGMAAVEESKEYTGSNLAGESEKAQFTFSYDVEIAVTEVCNMSGAVTQYVVAYNVTRTPAEKV